MSSAAKIEKTPPRLCPVTANLAFGYFEMRFLTELSIALEIV